MLFYRREKGEYDMKRILPELDCGKEIIRELEQDLEQYDKVVLVINDGFGFEDMTAMLIKYLEGKKGMEQLLIMSKDAAADVSVSVSVRKLTQSEEKDILSLYWLYDFSDRFIVISNDHHCGNLMNYVEAGKLMPEEAFKAYIGV